VSLGELEMGLSMSLILNQAVHSFAFKISALSHRLLVAIVLLKKKKKTNLQLP
jgi:hypothetical protein